MMVRGKEPQSKARRSQENDADRGSTLAAAPSFPYHEGERLPKLSFLQMAFQPVPVQKAEKISLYQPLNRFHPVLDRGNPRQYGAPGFRGWHRTFLTAPHGVRDVMPSSEPERY